MRGPKFIGVRQESLYGRSKIINNNNNNKYYYYINVIYYILSKKLYKIKINMW